MAANLLKAGYSVTVWNRSADKLKPLVDRGAQKADSPADAARGADVLFTMVSDGPVVTDLLFDRGAAEALPEGALVIDTSSILPRAARDHARRLAGEGKQHLDAPVSGGPSGAEQGKLAIMVGGEEEAFERGKGILSVLGRPTRVGPPGAGQLAKLSNQIIVGLAIGAVAEALLLAHVGGADAAAVRQAMGGGFADSLVLQIHGERMLNRTFLPGGPVSMHLKDLRNVLEEARQVGLDLPLSTRMHELFQALVESGGAGYDHSAALIQIERINAPARLGDKEDTLPG